MTDRNQAYRTKIEDLMIRYCQIFPNCKWPQRDEDDDSEHGKTVSEDWEEHVATWAHAFGSNRFSPGEVKQAMRVIQQNPPKFQQEHLPELLRIIREDRASKDAEIYRRDMQKKEEAYERPPAPRGEELLQCIEQCRGGPVAHLMRFEIYHYICTGELDAGAIPRDVLQKIWDEPQPPARGVSAPNLRKPF